MSEQFADHPDAVGDESGALDSEPSVVTDEDRLGTDPLEDGMDTAEGWSRDIRLGGTRASEETDTLDERLPQEVPDVGEGEIGAEPGPSGRGHPGDGARRVGGRPGALRRRRGGRRRYR